MVLEVTGKNNGVMECRGIALHYSTTTGKILGGILWH
jgi:hypothetical protein